MPQKIAASKVVYLLMFRAGDSLFIWCDEAGMAYAFSEEDKALATVERPYQEGHWRSYEGSMSACVHYITFRPRVVRASMCDLLDKVVRSPYSVHHCRNVAGIFDGIPCEGPDALALYESGKEPKLIDVDELRARQRAEQPDAAQVESAQVAAERSANRSLRQNLDEKEDTIAALRKEQAVQEARLKEIEAALKRTKDALCDAEHALSGAENRERLLQGHMVLPD